MRKALLHLHAGKALPGSLRRAGPDRAGLRWAASACAGLHRLN